MAISKRNPPDIAAIDRVKAAVSPDAHYLSREALGGVLFKGVVGSYQLGSSLRGTFMLPGMYMRTSAVLERYYRPRRVVHGTHGSLGCSVKWA